MAFKIFVDGQEGTTGLKINERLAGRKDLEILKIDPEKRKDTDERKKMINSADAVFLCLPDVASKEAVTLVENPNTRIIDASTAHRTAEGWLYGFPEMDKGYRNSFSQAKRVTVPGCYATGFVALMHPLVKMGLVPAGMPVSCTAVSGYSGGGKKLIEQYENPSDPQKMKSPRHYALVNQHKHIPEMKKWAGLDYSPLFMPIVAGYFQGMTVAVPFLNRELPGNVKAADFHKLLSEYYTGEKFIRVLPLAIESHLDAGYLNAQDCNGTNRLDIFVFGNDEQTLVIARLDNLGKGASGAAVQCMNLMLGMDESLGLEA